MRKSRIALWLVPVSALLVLACLVVDCGGGAERPVLQGYFQASRLRDRMTLGNIATVSFDPNRDGQVEGFEILSVGPEDTRTLHIRENAKALQDATSAGADHGKKMKAYQDDHMEAIDRVLKGERSKGKITAGDAEVQKVWSKFRDDSGQFQKRVSEAREKLSSERSLAELSISTGGPSVDVTNYDGVLVSKDVTINATVRTPDGQTSQKKLVVTLTQARLKDEKGQDVTGRWLVTAIKAG